MTTITSEHLELAAKAAGHTVKQYGTVLVLFHDGELLGSWSPHTEPADTWQLAADCRLAVDFFGDVVRYPGEIVSFGPEFGITAMEAVTLAAAEIGRAMG